MVKYTKLEQETSIVYNNEEDDCQIFTYDKKLIKKLKKKGVDVKDLNNDGSIMCTIPKSWIKITPVKIKKEKKNEKNN